MDTDDEDVAEIAWWCARSGRGGKMDARDSQRWCPPVVVARWQSLDVMVTPASPEAGHWHGAGPDAGDGGVMGKARVRIPAMPEQPLEQIVHAELDVKSWRAPLPKEDEARSASWRWALLWHGEPSAGGRLVLHGHGQRTRDQVGFACRDRAA